MDGAINPLLNLRGGINLKDKFSIGAYYSPSLNQINSKSEIMHDIYMDY